ncbi:MAG: DNA adenine methylase [Armatimonadetes bacterium]|nr:DNA adenine methylase [Armatimonadota bacterium]
MQVAYHTDQLIPYIGNKRRLLSLIHRAICSTGVAGGTFYDCFAGSGVVSRLAKTMGYRVVANDWEPYARIINTAWIAANRPPAFSALGGMDKAFRALNDLPGIPGGYIASHYCPADDECPNPDSERMFYTQENGRRIDAVRERIAEWSDSGAISVLEEAVLLGPLIFQAAWCSNTSGVFKGWHRGWGGSTKTAWYRIRSRLTLSPPTFWDNGLENTVLQADASDLLGRVCCDIAYLDPPYNQHQYGANYHLLNTVALWDKPPVGRVYQVGSPENGKSAIRTDWRVERRSAYCHRSRALTEFRRLIAGLDARHIILSYSTDGIIAFDDLLDALATRGRCSVLTRVYKRYRVSRQRPSPRRHNIEFVVLVDTGMRSSADDIEKVKQQVHGERIWT